MFSSAMLENTGGKNLLHGFSGGFARTDERGHASQIALWLERQQGRKVPSPILLQQTHGTGILDATGHAVSGPVPVIPDVDGAQAAGPATPLLLVKSADCAPILAVDAETRRCAALHAGWRGVAAGILPRLLEQWRAAGSSLRQVRMAFGPHIRACCFQVRQDCIDRFAPGDLAGAVTECAGTRTIALEAVLRTQAAAFGVGAAQIDALPHCTDCGRSPEGEPLFASYRRAGRAGRQAGRNYSFIAMLPEQP